MNASEVSSGNTWPALAYTDWADTCNTLHLWTQVVGKVKLALAPLTNHWWGIVLFAVFRARYAGKTSPSHCFWGSFDRAVTRFSGRAAPPLTGSKPPNVAPWVMQESYSHECSSLGFWPGNGGYGRAAFYAYAYPEPEGFGAEKVAPQGAAYNADVGQFLLDYDAVRAAASPDAALLDFAQSTYEAAANRGGWERKALERH